MEEELFENYGIEALVNMCDEKCHCCNQKEQCKAVFESHIYQTDDYCVFAWAQEHMIPSICKFSDWKWITIDAEKGLLGFLDFNQEDYYEKRYIIDTIFNEYASLIEDSIMICSE